MTYAQPATFSGNISGVTVIGNVTTLTVRFDHGVPVVINTTDADQIAALKALSQGSEYVVFVDPMIESGEYKLKLAYGGAAYSAALSAVSAVPGASVTFTKDS